MQGPQASCCLGAVSRAGSVWHWLPGLRGASLPNTEDRQLVITLGQSALGRGVRTPAIGERGNDAQICWSSLKRSRKCPEPQLCLGLPGPAPGPPPHPVSPAPSLWFTPQQLLWGPRPLKNSVCKVLGCCLSFSVSWTFHSASLVGAFQPHVYPSFREGGGHQFPK